MWNEPMREKYVAANKAERSWEPEKCFDIRHRNAQFRIYPAGFNCLGLVFPHHAPLHPFWNDNVYSVHCILEVCDLTFDFDITVDYS